MPSIVGRPPTLRSVGGHANEHPASLTNQLPPGTGVKPSGAGSSLLIGSWCRCPLFQPLVLQLIAHLSYFLACFFGQLVKPVQLFAAALPIFTI